MAFVKVVARRRTQEVDQMGLPQKVAEVNGKEVVVPTSREYNGEEVDLNTDNVVMVQTLGAPDLGYFRVVTLVGDFLVDATDKAKIVP